MEQKIFLIDENKAKHFARYIHAEISEYIACHQEEYLAFLAQYKGEKDNED